MNKENLVNKFLDYELSAVHSKIIDWQGYDTTKKNLKTKIEKYVNKVFDEENTSNFQILEFQNQKISLIMLYQIENNYSIDVYFSSFSIITNIEFFIEQIKLAFPKKNIEKINFTDSRIVDLSILEVNRYTYAGKISLIKQTKRTKNYNLIKFNEAKEKSFYPEYKKMYDEFYKDFPKLQTIIGEPESVESIEYLIENGIIKLAYINNEIAGVIIGLKMIYNEMSGYFVCDKILSRKYRGKGFGIAMERKFIDLLEISENELIFGTINSENFTAYRASTKVGRICTEVHYQIKSGGINNYCL